MPEGHTIHRLAAALDELYGGQSLRVRSPQGRFADGASRLDGQVLLGSQAHGKHLFLPFGPRADMSLDDTSVTWLRIHLGLYGAWTFDGDREFTAPHAIGAPRRRVGERGEHALK
ncbi:MAG: DNA-formamidopyrimidine glycosylase family protein, partial [Actinomyces oris]